jgi:hypothetical protein
LNPSPPENGTYRLADENALGFEKRPALQLVSAEDENKGLLGLISPYRESIGKIDESMTT